MEIKPCPNCGGKGILETTYDKEWVECENCGFRIGKEIGDYYDEGFMDGSYAIPKWNKIIIKKRRCNEMKELYELMNLFLDKGYSWEQIEYTCKSYWSEAYGIMEEAITDIIISLKEEMSYWK